MRRPVCWYNGKVPQCLVHRYQIVDDLWVYHLLCEGLADWEAFISSISAYMQGEPDTQHLSKEQKEEVRHLLRKVLDNIEEVRFAYLYGKKIIN